MALAAYRNLLRSTRLAFQGDNPTLTAARKAARDGFEQQRTLSAESNETREAIEYGNSVAQVLRENVVQGRAIDGSQGKYKLRIHEQTERGDNDTIKTAGTGTRNTVPCEPCS